MMSSDGLYQSGSSKQDLRCKPLANKRSVYRPSKTSFMPFAESCNNHSK